MTPTEWGASVSETHVSVVVFVGDRAYKLKKPVSLGFLDFSTRERRAEACRREVELNRRLAPDVYLGVLDVLDDEGRPVDHLVAMRRMPAERRLSTLVTADPAAAEDEIDRVAKVVAGFHEDAAASPEIAQRATRDAVRALWDANAAQLAPLAAALGHGDQAAGLDRLASRYLDGRAPLFDWRIAQDKARDGHGDLLADDIFCLPDGPRILDCVEFDDRLRYGDVLADVSFLAMDLERLGTADLAARLLDRYREHTADVAPASLADFYVAYRAAVRAKVAAIQVAEGDAASQPLVADLLGLARRRLEAGRVRLVLVGGGPGTGKTTLAAAIGEDRGWPALSSDVLRKQLAGLAAEAPNPAAFGEGLYQPAWTERVYGELLRQATVALGMGESVILDASWSSAVRREAACCVARAASADLVELRCEAPWPAIEARTKARAGAGGPSDADPDIARRLAAAADPWPSAVTVDTGVGVNLAVQTASQAVDAPGLCQERMAVT